MELKDVLADYTTPQAAYNDLISLVAGPPLSVPVESVKSWALKQSGLVFSLKQAAKGMDTSAVLADTILEAIGINMPPWDMTDPANIGLMDNAVAVGLMAPEQKTSLISLADSQIPKWQDLGLQAAPQLWQIKEALQ